MRTAALGALALLIALAVGGCGRRTQESVQQQIASAAEELVNVLDSDMPEEQKLARVRTIAQRLQSLSEQARELGEPTGTERMRVGRTRPREHEAAKKLQGVADTLAEQQ